MSEAKLNKQNLLVVAIAASAVAAGLLAPSAQLSRVQFLFAQVPSFIAWVLLYGWYKADIAQRRTVTGTTFNGLVIAFTLFALPIYFVRTRGLLRGALSTALFCLGFIAWSVLAGFIAVVLH